MANPITDLPLYERIPRKNKLKRATELVILFLLVSLLIYRLRLIHAHGFVWLLAFFCESWFTFIWILVMNAKWHLFDNITHPDRLKTRIHELPPVDLFVTTADPVLEPPIITVNTVLSLLALDYPANKLACYVSDDGASPIIFYSLVEAIKFAKLWIPFCKKYNIQTRAPFRYFSNKEFETSSDVSSKFQNDILHVKEEYAQLCRKIEAAEKHSDQFEFSKEFSAFSKLDRRNHQSIVKVIWEKKDDLADGVPHLVYVAREKRPQYPHHYKAGAMNALARVSGVMTNSRFMLNVDCDMFANNAQVVLHAMCLLLGSENEREIAYVQCPQHFYGDIKDDDPFGASSLKVLQEYITRGVGGIQGPFYGGSGCFHRRDVIYGLSPNGAMIEGKKYLGNEMQVIGMQEKEGLKEKFGCSTELVNSASQTLLGSHEKLNCPNDISRSLTIATHVADCIYESDTLWGKKIGWLYGSTAEDVLTGLQIHASGWRSAYLTPRRSAFLGCAAFTGPAVMTQQKRWATGLLEILFSKNSPIIATIKGNLKFRQCLSYLYINIWALRSIPELSYVVLPAYCFLTNTYIFPKVSENAFWIPISLVVIYNLISLSEYFHCGFSVKVWWNNQRMSRITATTAWLFGVLSVLLKLLRLSDTVFEITSKDQGGDVTHTNPGQFTFDDSPIFIPGTAIVLMHITALVMWLLGIHSQGQSALGAGLGEVICSSLVLLNFLSFLKGCFGKGSYGIPLSTISKSVALVGFFIYFCRRAS
ncbi:Cellulose synthase-like protein b3 [Thalictrum thalictroides]|uniref:Cellulose synthase-like protein b3 n=1 Tax=Thalictrum thalictroides TaxID=46969 RepID=A0A7J6VKQ3_THATH|nr:Cellulose synthase-like protein b3 [Thalictrum thalictroides]